MHGGSEILFDLNFRQISVSHFLDFSMLLLV
jgi:hypothetical protein